MIDPGQYRSPEEWPVVLVGHSLVHKVANAGCPASRRRLLFMWCEYVVPRIAVLHTEAKAGPRAFPGKERRRGG